MSTLTQELEANFKAFTNLWKQDLPRVIASLETEEQIFLESYTRISTLNAWKENVLINEPEESLLFFAEALNDALISHVFASLGTWRSALIALRSCIENCLFFLYYKDHPVELRLWEQGKHKAGFTELHNYLVGHPELSNVHTKPICGLSGLKEEYATLSRAVHASAKSFRMRKDLQTSILWTDDPVNLSMWQTRARSTIKNINFLLIALYRDKLIGTNNSSLRKIIGQVISSPNIISIKKDFNIVIPSR